MAVGLPVVEDIPVLPDVQQPAVGIAQVVQALSLVLVAVQEQVTLAHQRASEGEAAVGPVADRIAQLVVVSGGVDEDVLVPVLADGAGLKKLVVGEGAGALLGKNHLGLPLDGEHIPLQLHHRAAVIAQLLEAGDEGGRGRIKPGVQPDPPVVVRQHAGVEGELVALPPSPDSAVGIMDMAKELVFPCRGVADGHPHNPHEVKGVVEIIPPVHPPAHVGGEQQPQAQLIFRILVLAVDHALIPPVGQVVHRGGPAHVVVDAEDGRVEPVVGTVDVDPVFKHMGLAVRDILPAGEIGVERLLCFHAAPPHFLRSAMAFCSSGRFFSTVHSSISTAHTA